MAWLDKRTTTKGEARYLVGWREPGTGRRFHKSFHRDVDARRFKREVESKLDQGDYVSVADRKQPLGEFIESMLASSHNIAPSTRAWYRQHYEGYVPDSLRRRPVGQITRAELQAFFNDLIDTKGNGTVNAVRQVLTKAFNSMVEDGQLTRSPIRGVEVPKRERKEIEPVPLETIEALADAIDPRYRAALLLAAYGSLRAGEIGGLRVQDIDFLRRSVTVNQAVRTVKGKPGIAAPKTDAGRRRIAIPQFLAEELSLHMEAYGTCQGELVFCTVTRKLVDHNVLNKALRNAAEKLGIKRPTFHSLRHTGAALAIQAGAHVKAIQLRMGHANIKETMDTYGALMPGMDAELADQLDDVRARARKGGQVLPMRAAEAP